MEDRLPTERYQIERPLGRGGMGDVFLVRDKLLNGELVALKIVNAEFASDARFRESFIREVQATRRIIHPNIVRTFEVGEFEDRLYFVMEFVEAHSLEEILAERRVKIERAISLVSEAAKGLAAIHDAGIIHGDLKSANILVTPIDTIKISDFGLSHTKALRLRDDEDVIGSMPYMAPEAWEGELSAATDIYALGVVAYEAVAGFLPFGAEHAAEMRHRHVKVGPKPLTEERNIPEWFSKLVDKMLAKSACQRPSSAAAICEHIEEQLSDGSIDYCRALQIAMAVSDLAEDQHEELWKISHKRISCDAVEMVSGIHDTSFAENSSSSENAEKTEKKR